MIAPFYLQVFFHCLYNLNYIESCGGSKFIFLNSVFDVQWASVDGLRVWTLELSKRLEALSKLLLYPRLLIDKCR